MDRHYVLSVHLHDRFHGMAFGAPEWPPSPARVFQALVAGVARGRAIPEAMVRAFEWLETLEPPHIGAPRSRLGAEVKLYVPNNDLDAEGGDPARTANIRTEKRSTPRLLEGSEPLLYVWSWQGASEHEAALVHAAEQLYQLGRGTDLAWARAEILGPDALATLLRTYPGTIYRPGTARNRSGTLCPTRGSLASLRRRFEAPRIVEVVERKKRSEIFQNAPKPVFQNVGYERQSHLEVFELLRASDDRRFYPAPLHRVGALIPAIRDAAARRLREAFPEHEAEIDRILIGRKPDGSNAGPIEDRVRIIPLPSIGHPEADMDVRRIAVSFPGGSAIAVPDLVWAFDGASVALAEGGPPVCVLARSPQTGMLDRYQAPARRFRTVTPIALPWGPRRPKGEGSGTDRVAEEQRASRALHQALRHAGVLARVESLRLQREPLDRRGSKSDRFAAGTRFGAERLWHADITFDRSVTGPLVVGDGRFLGLGLMAPLPLGEGIFAFAIEEGLAPGADSLQLTSALRRAVMSRLQEVMGRNPLPRFFTGHEEDGAPDRGEDGGHLAFAFDPEQRQLFVLAPHLLDQRPLRPREVLHLETLDRALLDFRQLRAGSAGLLALRRLPFAPEAPPFSPARIWRTVTPYLVTRHARGTSAAEALMADVRTECRRRGLPPILRLAVESTRGVAGIGLTGTFEVEFARPVLGPLLLGRNRHFGGGFLAGTGSERTDRS